MKAEVSIIEQNGWKALATDQFVARSYYKKLLGRQAKMFLPGGIVLNSPDKIVDSFDETPWNWFRIEDESIINLEENAKLLTYQVKAQRQGEEIYEALVSSVYVRIKGAWKLVFHQQTAA